MTSTSASPQTGLPADYKPWPALIAMVIGFFMILVDTTIVSVATPDIIVELKTDYTGGIWVTSAYLLAYAVPLLITGRLGDRFGPRNLYLTGLAIFTAASLWCGLTDSISGLIFARVVQGLGAAMITPQTMAVITRTFAPARRGAAMALWGAVAGVATLVGPVLGGVLVGTVGWEWIFFVNVPVGIIGFILAARLVPRLPTHSHTFDLVGVGLSALGMFALVFGIQEGERYDWGTINGALSVPLLIGGGLLLLAAFIWWQSRVRTEPLVPLSLFRDRNFAVANIAIALVSASVTSMSLPFMFYAQGARGWSPTQAGLLMAPMAVSSMVLAPIVGRLVDRGHPRAITMFGFAMTSVSMIWIALVVEPNTPVWQLLIPTALLGIGSAFLWAPLAATATRNLPLSAAGAGSGVYNATRQVAAALGSAAIAALISARLAANGLPSDPESLDGAAAVPEAVAEPFTKAMAESYLLPFIGFTLGLLIVIFFRKPTHSPDS